MKPYGALSTKDVGKKDSESPARGTGERPRLAGGAIQAVLGGGGVSVLERDSRSRGEEGPWPRAPARAATASWKGESSEQVG